MWQNCCLIFTNGCFDLLHAGHIHLLRWAKRETHRGLAGDPMLIVGLNNDESVRRLKGPKRPFQSERLRLAALQAIPEVNGIIIFQEDTPERLITDLRPDILVKGGEYQAGWLLRRELAGGQFVQSYGGRVAFAPLLKMYSTSKIAMERGLL